MECFKKCVVSVLEWPIRLLNVHSFDMGVAPMDWHGACIVPIYKDKGDKYECSNSRGTSLLTIVDKLYGREPIKTAEAGTECAIWRFNESFGRVEGAWIKCLL